MRIILFMVLSIILVSCNDLDNSLTLDDRKVVDSLYHESTANIRREVDSICDLRRRRMFSEVVDSIKMEYIKEIEDIIK